MKSRLKRLLLIASCSLFGCSGPAIQSPGVAGGGPAEESEVSVLPLDTRPDPTLINAENTWEDPLGAARRYLEQAETATPPRRQDWQLQAAEALIAAGRAAEAERVLSTIDLSGMPDSYRTRERLARGRAALRRDHPRRALSSLAPLSTRTQLDPRYRADLLWLRGRALLRLGRKMDGIRALLAREDYLVNVDRIKANQRSIWRALGGMKSIELQAGRQQSTSEILDGWLDLALLDLEFGVDRYRFGQVVAQWQQIYPDHPAQTIIKDLLATTVPTIEPVSRIALLLPLTSRFSDAAQAVRDGFQAMHASTDNPRKPALNVYDIGSEPGLASLYYRLAVDEGADFIVGPLGKNAVAAVIDNNVIRVPTLLLGATPEDTDVPPQVYRFDLAPEQEAREVAERAYRGGHRIASVLHANNDWGTRIYEAFAERWLTLGGQIGATQAYDTQGTDYSAPVKALLNIDASENRRRSLADRLGARVEFQPRRRQDLDFLFVAANSRTARLLKPQINFFQAHDLPVYATSHVYAGMPDPVNDADLNNIRFGDMPWLLHDSERMRVLRDSIDPQRRYSTGPLARLFALGVDAYSISLALPELARTGAGLIGTTAFLRLASDGRIVRHLTWARFENGVPVPATETIGEPEFAGLEYNETEPQSPPPSPR